MLSNSASAALKAHDSLYDENEEDEYSDEYDGDIHLPPTSSSSGSSSMHRTSMYTSSSRGGGDVSNRWATSTAAPFPTFSTTSTGARDRPRNYTSSSSGSGSGSSSSNRVSAQSLQQDALELAEAAERTSRSYATSTAKSTTTKSAVRRATYSASSSGVLMTASADAGASSGAMPRRPSPT